MLSYYDGQTVSYQLQLDRAVEAARQAGQLLREEFHRPGGPRGSGDHAEADRMAEEVINRLLMALFPDYGYRGEELETVQPPGDQGGHLWLVDPNDGTRAFLKGLRGPAVSIALLAEGEPVLGVVYSYCAPDDDGDLLAWSQGTGPLRRNGREAARQWPRAASSRETVLVSETADRHPAANARLASPMRYRAMPSIAYRLAMVAAGEGDTAVSLTGPVGWDYAAGHALLRGAGADLYDRQGRPVRYERNGISNCGGWCFGGPPELVNELVRHDWASFASRRPENREIYTLCRPVRGSAVPDAGLLSRAQGCLLGQLAGDALGSLVEFRTPQDIAAEYPGGVRLLEDGGTWSTIAGQPTDDSELALALARSILLEGTYNEEAAARAYAYWYRSGPFDIGGTTQRALAPAARAVEGNQSAAAAARQAANPDSQANGALMRISPLGILGSACPPEQLASWARADAALSHPHRITQDAGAVFALSLALAIQSGEPAVEVHRQALKLAATFSAEPNLVEVLRAAEHRPPSDYCASQGWVLTAFHNAFYQLLRAESLESGIVDTVMRGGDTDTNAAIAGALLGSVWGRQAVPPQWLDRILSCRPIPGLPGVRRPRPPAFWPVDALCLAERLLLAGG